MIRNVHPRFRIPDPGVKKAPDPGSGSATLILCNVCRKGLSSNFKAKEKLKNLFGEYLKELTSKQRLESSESLKELFPVCARTRQLLCAIFAKFAK